MIVPRKPPKACVTCPPCCIRMVIGDMPVDIDAITSFTVY